MSLPVILRSAADVDIQTTYDQLEQVQAGLGARFVNRVREVLDRIEALPEMLGLVLDARDRLARPQSSRLAMRASRPESPAAKCPWRRY